MKEYTMCFIKCSCSKAMKRGKLIKAHRYTPERRRCPSEGCNKNLRLQILKKKPIAKKVLVR